MANSESRDEHGRFRKLCALAQSRSLSLCEQLDLDDHLRSCETCRAVYADYSVISDEVAALLRADGKWIDAANVWKNEAARARLLSSVKRQRHPQVVAMQAPPRSNSERIRAGVLESLIPAAIAACLLVAVTFGAYRMGERKAAVQSVKQETAPLAHKVDLSQIGMQPSLALEQRAKMLRAEKQIADEETEMDRLRASLSSDEALIKDLGRTNGQNETAVRHLTEQRDELTNRLTEKEAAYRALQIDYNGLLAEQNNHLLRAASMESELNGLRAANKDQERRLKDAEQFLSSDRDIRELMGARKLYIADVFDVDSVSRTRKPFGRVFYTQNKSLVFYAFDLDHQPGVKNAAVFQVWGQRDAETNGGAHPMNLGILYLDNETNRRWVLRSDDPKQLAEIDAVFVTVEPRGGSAKPTGKPFLYALLRKEANHP